MEREPWLNLFMLAILCLLISGAPSSDLCSDEDLSITEGSFSLSEDKSLVRYSCSEGYYPTIKIRRCNKGEWNPMPDEKPTECKKITCPYPRGFENGDVYPNLPAYVVTDTTHYSCNSGYTLRGSGTRVCQLNGKWSGSTPVCGRNSDHCPDPGTPAGTTRTGHIFNIDDKVTYHCDDELTLIGSKERVCQDDGQWSGTEPECYADFTYDTPEEATEGFSSSLKSNLELSQQHEGTDQQVDKGGNKLDIYIAMDVSGNIEKAEFEKAKRVIKTLIKKIKYYKVSPNYEILIFDTDVHWIVSGDFQRGPGNYTEKIIERLANYTYKKKGGSGTNIAKAYRNILESMRKKQRHSKEDFMQTQHIVIMFTDGKTNIGAKIPVREIKTLVIQNNPSRENKLGLYVFGTGDDVNAKNINDLKTDRGNERFFFKLQSIDKLTKTFDDMIDEGTSVALCGLYRDYDDGSHKRHQHPWLAKISVTRSTGTTSKCLGSLVTSTFILTAAHCFRSGDSPDRITVDIGSNSKVIKVKRYIIHPRFNLKAKVKMGIPEYYEFDVALIQLEKLEMGLDLRPICIPCTKETSGALRLSDREGTCRKHKDVLMSAETVDAVFMTDRKKTFEKKFIKIKQGKRRNACVEDAKIAKGITAKNAEDIITDNFLCSGGTEPTRDDIACKDDSGGATYVVPGKRLVQVGIISWGVKDLCASDRSALSDQQSRDFHTNLFSEDIRSFLKVYLGDATLGTPLTFIDEDSVATCGLYRDYNDGSNLRRQHPWLAKISVTRSTGKISNCLGSLVTSTFILTAAHCFRSGDSPDKITLNIGSDIKVKRYIIHPRFDLKAKVKLGKAIPEYYEFDVALIQLEKPVIMGLDLWPICIPCTKETSGALKLSDREGTCRKHKDMLMSQDTVDAAFMTDRDSTFEEKSIKIKLGNELRNACIEDAKKSNGTNVEKAEDIVTDNFLCSGGLKHEAIACKGDSGGATYVVPSKRIVQVGIVSWGVKDLCASDRKASSDAESRDYHTNLFGEEIRSFLKKYLEDDTLGTPLTFL